MVRKSLYVSSMMRAMLFSRARVEKAAIRAGE